MNNVKATALAAILAAATLSACAGNDTKPEPTADTGQAQAAITAAEAAVSKAGSVGYEWRDTGKILNQARAALKAGEHEKAVQLAGKAQRQGELAYRQYLAEYGGAAAD